MLLYCTVYRFSQKILANSWIFIKKNRDTWNTKHFQYSIGYYFLFNFLVFLTYFFFLFYLSMVFKKIVKCLCSFTVWIWDFIKKFCKTMVFFFQKKLRYLKYKMSTKFHRLLFLFYIFSIFGILFSISPTQTCPKIMEFLVVLYWKG